MDIPKQLKYRFCSYDSNWNVYSCDMLRLKFFINDNVSQRFLNQLSNLQFRSQYIPEGVHIDYYRGRLTKIGSYRHLFTIKPYLDTPWSLSVGFGLITADRHSTNICMIEFNPNKCDAGFVDFILGFLCDYITPCDGYFFHLVRFDLAVDIAVPRSDVVLKKSGKRAYQRIVSNSITEYSGCRNTNGFVKVYDKGYESDLGYDLTRIEITCDNFDVIPFPRICIFSKHDEDLSGLSNTDKVMLRLLRDLDYDAQQQALKDMGYVKARKLKEYLFPMQTEFKFDLSAVDDVISQIMELMEMGLHGHEMVELRMKLSDSEWCEKHEKDGELNEIRKKYLKLRKLSVETNEQSSQTFVKDNALESIQIVEGGDKFVQLDFSNMLNRGSPDGPCDDS